ncbi:MAG: class I SAM-dependent methyltransferase [Tannerellaceae bacterium]|nr:class I SAM-dependent methyltransferase [Tannerellaceae bacterium]
MQQRHTNRQQYFEELAETSQKYFIPFLEQYYGAIEGIRVLEIGCGDGCNLLPFLQKGCRVTGVDIVPIRIHQARQFFKEKGFTPDLICSDIFNLRDLGRFDIVMVHDVIEHISDKKGFLNHIRRFLEPAGLLYIAFPAWHMPFGGHQQICRNKLLSHFPYMHLLPRFVYKKLLETFQEQKDIIAELLDIKSCGITIEQFRELALRCHYKIVVQELYFINPHYEVKFGIKPRKLPALPGSIPWIRNFYTSSCFYLLKNL